MCVRMAVLTAAILVSSCFDEPLPTQAPDLPILSVTSSATTDTIFGPRTFVRGRGKPTTDVASIDVPDLTLFDGPLLMQVQNGDGNGTNRVSSGTVAIDGVTIFRPRDFSQQVKELTAAVSVRDGSELAVTLTSKPGSEITITITGIVVEGRATVDESGGVLFSPDGNLTLIIPENALANRTTLSVRRLSERAGLPSDSRLLHGTAYQLQPDDLTFAAPVQLRIRYDPEQIPDGVQADRLTLHRAEGDRWQEAALTHHVPGQPIVTGEIVSFSPWAILEGLPVDAISLTNCSATNTMRSGYAVDCSVTPQDPFEFDLYRHVRWETDNPDVARPERTRRSAGSARVSVTIRAANPGTAHLTGISETKTVVVSVTVDNALPSVPVADKIVFSRNTSFCCGTKESSIWMIDPDGSNLTRLTTADTFDATPDLSPDGSSVVFQRVGSASGPLTSDLFVLGLDGTGLRQITANEPGVNDVLPRWSPDGERIAFIRSWPAADPRTQGVVVVAADGTEARQITDPIASQVSAVTWSPDGTSIAYTLLDRIGTNDGVFIQQLDAGTPQRLTDFAAGDLSWSPTGRFIASSARVGQFPSNFEIFLLDAIDGTIRQLTSEPGEDRYPDWSPDGDQIVFASNRLRQLTQRVQDVGDLFLMDPDASDVRLLATDANASEAFPSWSGRKVNGSEPTVTVIGPEGGTATSPDGKLVIDVPTGAVAADAVITVGMADQNRLRAQLATTPLGQLGGILVGRSYTVESSVADMALPAAFNFELDPLLVPPNDSPAELLIVRRNAAGEYEIVSSMSDHAESPLQIFDPFSSMITAFSPGFSDWFAILITLGPNSRPEMFQWRIGDRFYLDVNTGPGASGVLRKLAERTQNVTHVVIHSTDSPTNQFLMGVTGGWAIANATCSGLPCAAHYYIGRTAERGLDGKLFRVYRESVLAPHVLPLKGFSNQNSIGIELMQHFCAIRDKRSGACIESNPTVTDPVSFTDAQYRVLKQLLCDIADRHGITDPTRIGLHRDIDPGRKGDPRGFTPPYALSDIPNSCDYIAYVSTQGGATNIWTIEPTGDGERMLTASFDLDGEPDWSRNRSQVVFVSQRDGNPELYIMNNDGTSPQRITDHPAADLRPAWSPTRDELVFMSDRNNQNDLYLFSQEDGLRRLTSTGANEDFPDWLPDGERIVYERNNTIWMVNRDGSEPHEVEPAAGLAELRADPAWSPVDANEVAYQCNRSGPGTRNICVLNVLNGQARQLTQGTGTHAHPTWSGDGAWIAYVSNEDGDFEIFAVPSSGSGSARRITSNHGADDLAPSWQPRRRH